MKSKFKQAVTECLAKVADDNETLIEKSVAEIVAELKNDEKAVVQAVKDGNWAEAEAAIGRIKDREGTPEIGDLEVELDTDVVDVDVDTDLEVIDDEAGEAFDEFDNAEGEDDAEGEAELEDLGEEEEEEEEEEVVD